MMSDSRNAIVPIPPIGNLEQVTDAQLARYGELIYQKTGIRISPQKKMLLSNRLRRRLRETGITDFEAYYQHLRSLPPGHPEWNAFLQEITTHETYLFRDEVQWRWFREEYLARVAAEAQAGRRPRSLRIWSAACSTGDEVYTIACCIAATLLNYQQWNITILGTDIGAGAIAQAQAGVFGERAMRLVPEEYRRRFFVKAKDAAIWQAGSVLKQMVSFRQHNLLEPLRVAPFDLVFLKNVLIYFDPASKRRVLENVRALIKPGGMLITGAAEGVAEFLRDFERLNPWLYRRPVPARAMEVRR
jgi:chemotaxis protein methyltransferase CheR